MRNLTYIAGLLWMLAFTLTGCSKEEIDYYDQTPRINFQYSNNYTSFLDRDYVSSTPEKELLVTVQLQGKGLSEARTFALKIEEMEGYSPFSVTMDESYTLPAETYTLRVPVKVTCPKMASNAPNAPKYRMKLSFANNDPKHQFDEGLVEKATSTVEIELYILKPGSWSERYWGTYSINKYLFMMDQLHQVYTIFSADDVLEQNRRTVREAYARYRETNDPIVDENSGEEIYFPE